MQGNKQLEKDTESVLSTMESTCVGYLRMMYAYKSEYISDFECQVVYQIVCTNGESYSLKRFK